MKILYADGNGNRYLINGAKRKGIEYVPVKPAYSSSGIYDGGKHVKKVLSDEAYSRILSSIMVALNTPLVHVADRVMGSGSITVEENGTEKSCILKPGAAEQGEIESILRELFE